ncbi:MAG: metalloregulator ArsR/SmtB family transcription factor [Acidimicrobiales bacterium]
MNDLLVALKAVAEPTRLRILAAVQHTELTVSELCDVLGQSQPRVSRHLKLLCEAQLLDRHSQGTKAFYRPVSSGVGRQLTAALGPLIDQGDPVLRRDLSRLDRIRSDRNRQAQSYFDEIAGHWDGVRQFHVSDAEAERKILAAAGDLATGSLLDIGTGTGRILELFGSRIETGIGIDLNGRMLDMARSNLDQAGLSHCSVRHGNVYDLEFPPGSFDMAVLHHVLHFLDDPQAATFQAAKTLRPGGRLIIVDFATHDVELLRTDYAHYRLGFDDAEVTQWCSDAGLVNTAVTHLTPSQASGDKTLTVTIWVASQHAGAAAQLHLEAAS